MSLDDLIKNNKKSGGGDDGGRGRGRGLGVSNDDIKGTAEIVYSRRQDALAAVKRYNNVQLDGKPMKIEIVGFNIVAHVAGPPLVNNFPGNFNGFPRRYGFDCH